MRTYETGCLKIAGAGFSEADGKFALADGSYLIARKDKGTNYVRDVQKLRSFGPDWTFETMRKAGFRPAFSKEKLMPGRELVIVTQMP